MSSNLTNQFISNTFQNLVQIQGNRTNEGLAPLVDINNLQAIKLLDGIGRMQQGIMLEHNNGGGFFTKNTGFDGVWRIQHRNLPNNEQGLNFGFKPDSSNFENAKLFIKNTGSVWVGFSEGEIESDLPNLIFIAKTKFYIKGGIGIVDQFYSNNLSYNNTLSFVNVGNRLILNGVEAIKVQRITNPSVLYTPGTEYDIPLPIGYKWSFRSFEVEGVNDIQQNFFLTKIHIDDNTNKLIFIFKHSLGDVYARNVNIVLLGIREGLI